MSLIKKLYPANQDTQKKWLAYDRFIGRTLSPSYIESLASCPAKTYMEKLATSSYDAFVSASADAYGSAVHDALEHAFSFLQTEKDMWKKKKGGTNPSSRQIERMLRRSHEQAVLSLKQHIPLNDPVVGRMKRYVNDVIKDYGTEYLSDSTVFLASEMHVQSLDLPTSIQVGGNLDLALYNAKDKTMKLIDFKWARKRGADHGHDYLSVMRPGAMEAPEQHIQPKIYAYSLLERNAQIEKIHFMYDVYWDLDDPSQSQRQKIFGKNPFTRDDPSMARLKTEITDSVSQVMAHERELSSVLQRGRKQDVLRMVTQVKKGTCSPQACNACPFRYQCSFKNFAEEAQYSAKGMYGEVFADTELRKLDHLENENFSRQMRKQYEEAINVKKVRFRVERYNELMTKHTVSPQIAHKIAEQDAEALAHSYQNLAYYRRGLFADSVKKGAYAARTQLPFSILDPDMKAVWMSNKLRRNIYNYSIEHVERLSHSFDVPVDLAKEMVVDAVYKDRELAAHLHKSMIDNTNAVLEKQGLSLGKAVNAQTFGREVNHAMKQYSHTIDRNMALTVQGALDREFIRYVMTIDQEKIRSKLNTAKLPDIEGILKGLADKKLIESDPDAFLSRIAHSETFGSVLEKTRLSSPKFPVGSMVLAGLLTYIAGADSIVRQMGSKYDKLKFYLSHQEKEVDDGSHASVYGVSRRLLYSDFGSPVRFVSRRSDVVLKYFRNYRDFFKDAISIITGIERNKNESLSHALGRMFGSSSKSLGDVKNAVVKDPGLLVGGAAVGFVISGILPNIKTDREIARDVTERKKRFKRLKKSKWNQSSPAITPESDLRERTRIMTPIGSKIFKDIAVGFIAPSIKKITLVFQNVLGKIDYSQGFDALKKGTLDAWSGVKKRAERVFSHSDWHETLNALKHDIGQRQSVQMLTKGTDIVKRGAQKAQTAINESQVVHRMRIHSQERLQMARDGIQTTGKRLADVELQETFQKAAAETVAAVDDIYMAIPKKSGALSVAGTYTHAQNRKKHVMNSNQNYYAANKENHRIDSHYYDRYDRDRVYRKTTIPDGNHRRIAGVDMSTLLHQSKPYGLLGPVDFSYAGKSNGNGMVRFPLHSGVRQASVSTLPQSVRILKYPQVIPPINQFQQQWSTIINVNRTLMNRSRMRNSWMTNGSATLQQFHDVIH